MSKFSFANLSKKYAAVAAIAVVTVSAQAMGAGGPMEPGGHRGGAEMMMARSMEHMLDSVDASDAQRAQVKQIMQSAISDLKPQRESGRKLHMQMMDLLSAASIDAGAVENLRQQVQTQQDVSSKRMSQAMVDAARVLTPEQRAKLAERMKKMQARMAEHRGGKPGGQ